MRAMLLPRDRRLLRRALAAAAHPLHVVSSGPVGGSMVDADPPAIGQAYSGRSVVCLIGRSRMRALERLAAQANRTPDAYAAQLLDECLEAAEDP